MNWGKIGGFRVTGMTDHHANTVKWINEETGEVESENTLYSIVREYLELKQLECKK